MTTNNNVLATHTDKDLFEYVLGSFCVANRTTINKILYTPEYAPEMVLIHVPPILRSNNQSGTLYFTFKQTYMLELECFYESLQHLQKVSVMNKACSVAEVGPDIHYNQLLIVPPNRLRRSDTKGAGPREDQ